MTRRIVLELSALRSLALAADQDTETIVLTDDRPPEMPEIVSPYKYQRAEFEKPARTHPTSYRKGRK